MYILTLTIPTYTHIHMQMYTHITYTYKNMYACVNICKVRKRKKRKWLESRQKTKLKFLPSFAQEMENIIPTQ